MDSSTGFHHVFDATSLREYDIRGVVGRTLGPADAFAIGRCFGTTVARGGGRTVGEVITETGHRVSGALRHQLLPASEIAELLGCAPGTVRGYASRALAALRVQMGPRPRAGASRIEGT